MQYAKTIMPSRTTTSRTAKVVVSLLLALSILAAGYLFVGTLATAPLPKARVLASLLFFATVFMPQATLGLLVLLLPIFGNKPGTDQALYLHILTASWIVGCALSFIIGSWRGTNINSSSLSKTVFSSAVLWLAACFTLASLFSLSSLPWNALLDAGYAQAIDSRLYVRLLHSITFFRLTEDTWAYSLLSVILTSFGFCVAVFLVQLSRRFPNLPAQLLLCLLLGAIISITVGLLDFFHFLDLTSWRALDPIVNPNQQQFRIQSFFGHSGWYAEYLVLAAPSTLLLLTAKKFSLVRFILVLFLLSFFAFALLLTFQRGGWISFPFTICGLGYLLLWLNKQRDPGSTPDKKSVFVKNILLGSGILAIFLIPLATLVYVIIPHYQSTTIQADIGSYIGRFKQISQSSDRSEFMRAGILIGLLHPIYGAGSESFFRQYEKEFMRKGGEYRKQIDLPLHGSAHSLYAQTIAGKGFVGVALLVVLIIGALGQSAYDATNFQVSPLQRFTLVACFCSILGFAVYSIVQEFFYIQSLQLMFFVVLGIIAAHSSHIASPSLLKHLAIFVLLLFIVHLAIEYVYPGQANTYTDSYAYGCYGKETDEKGNIFEWCGPKARIKLAKNAVDNDGVAILHIKTHYFQPGQDSPTLTISENGNIVFQQKVAPLQDYVLTFALEKKRRVNLVDVSIDSYFIPRELSHTGKDLRILAFQIIDSQQNSSSAKAIEN